MADYSGEELAFISRLLTRAGFWVSYAEDTDLEDKSEELEKARMVKALQKIGNKSSDFTIVEAARMALKNLRPPEEETEETLGDDIRSAVEMFKDREDLKALDQFKKALLYVGTSVARAYREELDHHEDEFLFENFLNKITGYLNFESDPEEFRNQNVSPAEDSALTFISEALRH